MCIILVCASSYGAYLYILNHNQSKMEKHGRHLMFGVGLFFIIATILKSIEFTIYMITVIFTCYGNPLYHAQFIGPILYALQVFALCMVLFARLYVVFNNSVFQLSKCTLFLVSSLFIIIPILIILSFTVLPSLIAWYMTGFIMFIAVLYCIWITSSFIYKLFKVYKNSNPMNDDALLSIITKNTILTLYSISATLLSIIFVLIVASIANTSPYIRYIYDFAFLFDVYTNFCCVMMSYKLFDGYYRRLCECCDLKCKSWCFHLVGKDDAKNMTINLKESMDVTANSKENRDVESPSINSSDLTVFTTTSKMNADESHKE